MRGWSAALAVSYPDIVDRFRSSRDAVADIDLFGPTILGETGALTALAKCNVVDYRVVFIFRPIVVNPIAGVVCTNITTAGSTEVWGRSWSGSLSKCWCRSHFWPTLSIDTLFSYTTIVVKETLLSRLTAIALAICTINRISIGGCCAALWSTTAGTTISRVHHTIVSS